MDFRFTEEEEMVRASARKLGARWGPRQREVAKRQLEESVLERAFFRDFAEAGFAGALIPEQYGGSGVGLTPLVLAIESMAIEGAGNTLIMLTQMNSLCILRAGPEEARQRYLPRVAEGELTMAFAITEPDAGSNSFDMRTIAERRGEDIVLNGTKTFITGVDLADKLLVIARSMPYETMKEKGLPKTAGFNVVVVDPKAKGFSKTELPTRGIEGMKQWTLHFDDVVCDDLIGEEHQGVVPMFEVLNAERTLAAASAVGMTQRMLDRAVEYAKARSVFGGKPIGAYQAIQHPLAEVKAELEAVRLLLYKCATLFDQRARPQEIGPLSTMCKYLAGELAIKAADRALQTHGGNGFSTEYGLIDDYVNARLLRTAPISREMVLNQVAEHVLGLPRSY